MEKVISKEEFFSSSSIEEVLATKADLAESQLKLAKRLNLLERRIRWYMLGMLIGQVTLTTLLLKLV